MCGVFGVFGHPEAARVAALGLHALQHRGQESAGVVVARGAEHRARAGMGLVQAVFDEARLAELAELGGSAAIGHVRYSTAGASRVEDAQPIAARTGHGPLALAHNGHVLGHGALRAALERDGAVFQGETDTESLVHLVARSRGAALEDRVAEALGRVTGAFSVVCLGAGELVAARDPLGLRPLCLGRLEHADGVAWLVASEPVAFELVGGRLVRDLEPGELLVVDAAGPRSVLGALAGAGAAPERRACIFELVYFARPDSTLGGASVYAVRKRLGARLAEHCPAPPDANAGANADAVVIAVPDSGTPAALGYAERARLPFEMGLVRSHYVGRTFLEPTGPARDLGVRMKLGANRAALEGKRVIVVDDSVVRGTTSRQIVRLVREAGAREVHLRVASPPTRWPCFYGIDTKTNGELLAASLGPAAIAERLGADSVAYLPVDALVDEAHAAESAAREAAGAQALPRGSYCAACFTGEYPTAAEHEPEPRPGARALRRLPTVGSG